MDLDLYNSSPVACAAGTLLTPTYSPLTTSIVGIVRENPKKETTHFGGVKDQAIRECYMDMI
jgi:fatty acid synthase subunit beta